MIEREASVDPSWLKEMTDVVYHPDGVGAARVRHFPS